MPAHHPDLSVAAIQTLFVSARPWDGSALLRELKQASGRWEKVKVEQFILGLLEMSKTLAAAGLSLTFEGGQVDLTTCRIEEGQMNAWLASFNVAGSSRFSESMLEALSIVALRQPVVAAEVEQICGVDRRDALMRLEGMGLIERRAGQDRAAAFVTTARFLHKFGGDALERLRDGVKSSPNGSKIESV